jgi:transcriptional regulator with XRE-family HTH domain
MDIKVLLGKKIREVRKAKKLTQEQMAELLGVETSSLSNIERGKYYPTSENLSKIIRILEVQPHELFNFCYLASHQELLDEIIPALKSNENLTRMVYKFYQAVK